MKKGKNNILFRYMLEDAWGVLISEITLLSDCDKTNVIGLNRMGEAPMWTVPAETVKRVRDIIRENESVLRLENIEEPFVLDGTINILCFSLGGKEKLFETYNLWAVNERQGEQPYESDPVNARKLVKLFEAVSKELISAGVDERYLQLKEEDDEDI